MAVDKRAALLEAAESVLVEHGLSGATVEQITARAGVAKGTYYLYFRSKDEVVLALQQRLWDRMMQAAVEAAGRLDSDDFWGAVDAFLETVVDFDLDHRDWHRLVAQGWTPPHGQEVVNEQQMIDLLTINIRSASERGLIAPCDEQMTATLLYRAIQGTSHQFCQGNDPIDRERMLTAFKWFVRRVLSPSEENPQT